ncbi:DNA primase [Spiribacter sp. C176]|uniref:DNA primase n=1 Tax=Spiribacter salilacus TaxID=2664894 RepID=A0A6N7QPG9_9GAMM|nr:DNA primase [Spiribacter salilacus]MRH78281.1 DNA primase [Spiribacter salilacus]
MAGRIPDHFIDELLSRIDIAEVVGERVQLRRSGSNHSGLCPFHGEKTPSFTVSTEKQFYHCFGCGAHGTAIRFLMEYDRLDFREAVAQLAAIAGMEIPESARDSAPPPEQESLYSTLQRAADAYRQWLRDHPQAERAVKYLQQRGLSGEIAKQYGIGFAPPGWRNLLDKLTDRTALNRAGLIVEKEADRVYDRFRDRIIFPIRDRRGRTIAFGGRVLDQSEPKYLNSPESPVFQKGQELYGLYEVLQADRRPPDILVVEGYMDVVALAQHGVPRAVATLGTATSTRQVERLFQITGDVIFCFDGDKAGRRAAARAMENALPAMRQGRQIRFLFLPEGEDPDSLIRQEGQASFTARLQKATPLSDFLIASVSDEVDLQTMDGRARLIEKATPLLRRLPPDVYRHMLFDRLAGLARIERDYLEQVVDQQQRIKSPPDGQLDTAGTTADQPVRRTPVRLAIALLLQSPSLATQVEDLGPLHDTQSIPGLALLKQLLELSRTDPHITTSALLERFRDSEHETALWKLATWDHLVPEAGRTEEFADIMRRIANQTAQQRLTQLNERLQSGELTPEEWSEWMALKK